MANSFQDNARERLAELEKLVPELEQLKKEREALRTYVSVLDNDKSKGAASPAPAKRGRPKGSGRKTTTAAAAPARRGGGRRRPRGLITGKVREFLQRQSQPVHATEILSYLEQQNAAPMSAKPMPTLQSTLQRMKEGGEIANKGRNRWILTSKDSGSAPRFGARLSQ